MTSALRHAVMVGDSLTGAGKRPSRDHAHKVLLPNGKNGISWLARLMPCGGKCLIEVVCFVASVLLGVLSAIVIMEVSISVCCFISITLCSLLSRNSMLRLT